MKRTLFAIGALLVGCGADDGTTPIGTEPPPVETEARAPDAVPFYEFEVGGHRFQFVQAGAGLVMHESSPMDAPSLLEGFRPAKLTVSSVHQFLKPNAAVPQELLDFDSRVELVVPPGEALPDPEIPPPQGSPAVAPAPLEPGQRPMHEAGGAHFQSSHCPTTPSPSTDFDFYEEHSPHSTRLFCWSGDHIGPWTESSTAKVLTHEVAAVRSSVRYEMKVQGWSGGWTVLQGQSDRWWGVNGKFWDCWCVPVCACGDQDYNEKAMSGKVFETDALTVWRFGGGFWK